MAVEMFTDPRYDGRYCAIVEYSPAGQGDPIPYLVKIYDALTDTCMESYWRGSADQAPETLAYWITNESPEAEAERENDD